MIQDRKRESCAISQVGKTNRQRLHDPRVDYG